MEIKEFITRNKVFFVFSVGAVLWMGMLAAFGLIFSREVGFYNYLAKEDVSSDYEAIIPLSRYLMEPIVGIAFNLTFEGAYFVIAVLGIYIAFRVVYGLLKSKDKIHSDKFNLLSFMLRDLMWFAAKIAFVVIAVLLAYFLIALAVVGSAYAAYGMFYLLEIVIWAGLIAFTTKLAFLLFKYFNPTLRFNYAQKVASLRKGHKVLAGARKEIMYLFGFLFLFLSSTVVLKMTLFPTYEVEPQDLDEGEILIDFHCHTVESDGWLTPEERVLWYIQHGIHAAVFSDHDTPEGALKAQRFVKALDLDFTVIMGQEFSAGNHLNVYGIEKRIIPEEKAYEGGPKALSIEEMIEYVKEEGGYVTVNHYDREGEDSPYTPEEYLEFGVDGFEIINKQDLQSKEIREFCLDNDLICLSGSDMHYNHELYSFVRLELQDPDDLSLDNIFDSLKNNKHQTVLIEKHPARVQFSGFWANFGEVENFSNYLLNLNTYQYLSWILWSLGGYLFVAFLYRRIKRLDVEKLREKIL